MENDKLWEYAHLTTEHFYFFYDKLRNTNAKAVENLKIYRISFEFELRRSSSIVMWIKQ